MATDDNRKVDGRRKAEFESAGDEAWQRVPTGGVVWPDPGAWDPVIVQWYEAQRRSGQAALLEQSDVASLYFWARILNDHLETDGVIKGSVLATWQQMCRDMLVTEGSRRRSKVAVDRGDDDDEDESQLPAPATVASLYSKLKTG